MTRITDFCPFLAELDALTDPEVSPGFHTLRVGARDGGQGNVPAVSW